MAMEKPGHKSGDTLSRKDQAKLDAWLKTQRGRPQYRHAPPARLAVAKIMKPLSAKHGAGVNAISQNWESLAGKRFAKISRPVKIHGSKEGRTLVIKAPGAAGALIMAASNQILDRLNTFLGHGHISRLRVIQGAMTNRGTHQEGADTRPQPKPAGLTPKTAQSLQSSLAHIEDDALREALEALGRKALAEAAQKRT